MNASRSTFVYGTVAARQHPRRGALVDVEVRDLPASSGPIWIADAPVPISATRLPLRSASWFHREEWKISPAKVSMPLMSGRAGSASAPTAPIRTFALNAPLVVSTSQLLARRVPRRASVTSVSNRCLSSTPYFCAVSRRYCWISGCGENERDQFGFSSKEYE